MPRKEQKSKPAPLIDKVRHDLLSSPLMSLRDVGRRFPIGFKKVLQEKNQHLSLLYKVSQALSASYESEKIYQQVLRILGQYLGYRELVLLIRNSQEKSLRVVSTYGVEKSRSLMGLTFNDGEGVTGEAIRRKEAVYIPDTKEEDRYLYYKGKKPEDVSFLSIPLIVPKKGSRGGHVIGVLNLCRPVEHPFSPQEQETLQAVAQQAALAIHNAQLYATMRELSQRDELTNLYNRRYGQEKIEQEIKRSQRYKREFSLLMIDIDHFKKYNDRHGHPQGDRLLVEFTQQINNALRSVDSFARWGGEEFVILLPNTDKEGGVQAAEKIRLLINQHTFFNNEPNLSASITVSIGVATYPQQGENTEQLIDEADKALYTAKKKGRNCVVSANLVKISQTKKAAS